MRVENNILLLCLKVLCLLNVKIFFETKWFQSVLLTHLCVEKASNFFNIKI